MEGLKPKTCTEIYEILRKLDASYSEKLPEELRKYFADNRDVFYRPKFDASKPLNEQEMSEETSHLLCALNLEYWASPEEKARLIEKYKLDEIAIDQELKEKYNPFKDSKDFAKILAEDAKNAETQSSNLPAVKSKNVLSGIITWLRDFANKFKNKDDGKDDR